MEDRLLNGAFLYYVRHFIVLDNVEELGPVQDALKTTMSPDTSTPSRGG